MKHARRINEQTTNPNKEKRSADECRRVLFFCRIANVLIDFHGNKPGKLLKSHSVWNCLSSCSSTLRSHPLLKVCIFYLSSLKIRFFFFGRTVPQHRQNGWKAHPRLKCSICTTWMRKLEAATSPCTKKWILQCSKRCEGPWCTDGWLRHKDLNNKFGMAVYSLFVDEKFSFCKNKTVTQTFTTLSFEWAQIQYY